ncbi:MAG: DMT family transporter [Paracoccaceae bacterium]
MAIPFWGALAAMIVAGAAVTTQATLNARMAMAVGDGLWAALLSFGVGFMVLLTIISLRGTAPQIANLPTVPWWVWLGGVCGVWIVCAGALSLPVLGAVMALSALILGQVTMGVLIDATGAFGLPMREIGGKRILALVMVIGGLALSRA